MLFIGQLFIMGQPISIVLFVSLKKKNKKNKKMKTVSTA